MIEFVRGIVLRKDTTHVLLDVNGVGYGLDVPLSTFAVLPETGKQTELYVHLYLQEQLLKLFGFATEQERDVFEVFIGTSGIGPKTALAILSSMDTATFASAIIRNDTATLTKLPGIGRKTAERLVVELKDKVALIAGSAPSKAQGIDAIGQGLSPAAADTAQALMALGCKAPVANRAAQKALEVLGATAPVEDLIREALKHRY